MTDSSKLPDEIDFDFEPKPDKDFGWVLTPAGEIVDFRGMGEGEGAKVFRDGSWVPFDDGTFGDIMDGIALTAAEAKKRTSGSTS